MSNPTPSSTDVLKSLSVLMDCLSKMVIEAPVSGLALTREDLEPKRKKENG